MGADKKKRRREENRALGGYFVRTSAGSIPMKDAPRVREILNALGEPYLPVLPDLEIFYLFTVFAWNLSYLPEDKIEAELDNFLSPFVRHGQEFRDTLRQTVLSLRDRKKALFPHETFTLGAS